MRPALHLRAGPKRLLLRIGRDAQAEERFAPRTRQSGHVDGVGSGLRSACAAARAVAPVVRMSSTSKMSFPATAAGALTENAPRTFSRRMRGVSPAWLSVARSRISALGASVSRHAGWLSAEKSQRLSRQRPRLVEAALRVLGAVQRHRNHQHFAGRLAGKLRNRLSQHSAQPARGRMQPVIFERVDRALHAAPIGAIRNRAHKRRRRKPAGAAEVRIAGAVERVAAAGTRVAARGRNFGPADITNWHGRELRQEGAAKST